MKRTSLLFPSLLVAAGVLWLLAEMGRISFINFLALNVLWPFVLIALGLGLILGARWRFAWNVIAVTVVTLTVLAIIFAPQLGLTSSGWTSAIPFVWSSERGSGHVVSQPRQVANFSAVTVNYPSDVVITQGITESLTIEAEDNVLRDMTAEVRDGVLYIGVGPQETLGSAILPTRPVRVSITVKNLSALSVPAAGTTHLIGLKTNDLAVSISGAGSVTIDNLSAQSFTSRMSGAGSVTASGTAPNVDVNISGFGSYNGAGLRSDTATASISGAGGATLWVVRQLNATISGMGSINYYGQPSVSQQVSGIGSVRRLGDK
jgi:hypothetical protein